MMNLNIGLKLALGHAAVLLVPSLFEEDHKYPAVFRPQEVAN
jgi:hypothetical protein